MKNVGTYGGQYDLPRREDVQYPGLQGQQAYYDNSKSGLQAIQLQDAIDELASRGIQGSLGPQGPIGTNGGLGQVTWSGQTVDATQIELYVLGVASSRCTIFASSAVRFEANAVAIKADSGDAKSWKITGLIKRDGSNSTVLIGSTIKVIECGTASWDVDLQADNTNGALVPKVTGEASVTLNWKILCTLTEIRN